MFDLPHNAEEKAKGRAAWQIVQEQPLTLTPSIQHNCSCPLSHGYIREGKWVRA